MLRVLSLMRSSDEYSVVVLPEPVGPGDQQDAVRLVDQLVHQLLGARIHAERIQLEAAGLLVEQTQHHALAVTGGDRRHAHVDRAAGDAQRDAAVLRQALLGDVELRHDLDARDHQRRDGAARLQHFAQHAVDAEAHDQAVLERLDVNVGGVVLDRLRQDRVDQLDDRRLVVAFQQVGGLRQILREVGEVGVVLHAADHLHGRVRAAFVLRVATADRRLRCRRAAAAAAGRARDALRRCWRAARRRDRPPRRSAR